MFSDHLHPGWKVDLTAVSSLSLTESTLALGNCCAWSGVSKFFFSAVAISILRNSDTGARTSEKVPRPLPARWHKDGHQATSQAIVHAAQGSDLSVRPLHHREVPTTDDLRQT